MFTGIVERKGVVINNRSHNGANRLVISSTFEHLQSGESIAVNGVCLTLLPSASLNLSLMFLLKLYVEQL